MVGQLSRVVNLLRLLFCLLLFHFSLQQEQEEQQLVKEKLALLELRSSLGLRAKEWPIKKNPCKDWVGITCSSSDGLVTQINISGFKRTRIGAQNPRFSVGSLQNFTSLISFNASGFMLPGSIPDWFGLKLNALQVLDLRSCRITGLIPSSLGQLSNLLVLDLSGNSLNGSIPVEFSGLKNLTRLDMSLNSLSGEIHEILWSMNQLRFLDASGNNFTGTLPNISSEGGINSVVFNISQNMLFGSLTPVIRRFSIIDLSGNYFQGKVPEYAPSNMAVYSNCLQNVSNQKNPTECASFYAGRGLTFDNFGLPVATQPLPRKKTRNIILGAVLGSAGFIALLISVFIILCVYRQKRGATNQRTGVGPVPTEVSPPSPRLPLSFYSFGDSFTYKQILKATGYFSDANLIKHGYSGDLFRGILETGNPVVIKKLDLQFIKKEAYMQELDFFCKVSHPRFVPLLGHCLENENEKVLVYKYMPNGDLSSSLFRKTNLDDDNLKSLDWITRLKIAIGAAEGLSYLHHECAPPLVHRDVQASSILLDDKFEVRLGSLREVFAQEGDTNQSRITRLLRLPSTSEQERLGTHTATCAYDVYCFGKVLLELVTGKLGMSAASDATVKDWLDTTLPHISIYERELVTDILDPSLIIDEDLLEEVWAMAIVARSCLNPKPSRRPLMRYILKALENPLKVIREEQISSARLRTNSSRGSWNASLFGSWRRSSSDVAAIPAAPVNKVEGGNSFKQSGTLSSLGSGRNGEGCHSSNKRQLKEIFPEPLDECALEEPTQG